MRLTRDVPLAAGGWLRVVGVRRSAVFFRRLSAELDQHAVQRPSARQSSGAGLQGGVDRLPILAFEAINLTGTEIRISTRAAAVGVGPCQDLLDRQRRRLLVVAPAAMLLQEAGQRPMRSQTTQPLAESKVDRKPILTRRGGTGPERATGQSPVR